MLPLRVLATIGRHEKAEPVLSDWLRTGRPRGRSSSPFRGETFLLFMFSRPALGSTQSSNQWIPRALSPGVKQPRREADHSSPTSAQVNTPTPHAPSWRNA
jgi:hypothetical protein